MRLNAGGMLYTCKSNGSAGQPGGEWRTGSPRRRSVAGLRGRPATLGLRHGPDSYGRQQWGILDNGRKPDPAMPRERFCKSDVKAPGLTWELRWRLQGLNLAEGGRIPRVAVKCVEMWRNTDGEGSPLGQD
ncbi:hypothetical protein Lal_00014961 [Lupinus albus]|nr:hypothetical protein Lal_00014961 [Lupinus albus]